MQRFQLACLLLVLLVPPLLYGQQLAVDTESGGARQVHEWVSAQGAVLLVAGLLLLLLLIQWRRSRHATVPAGYRDAVDRQLAQFRELAANDPGRVAQVLRQWMSPSTTLAGNRSELTPRELGSLLVLSLPNETAVPVIREFLPAEAQALSNIMARIPQVRREALSFALTTFFHEASDATGFGVKSEGDLQDLFEAAFGEKKSRMLTGLTDIRAGSVMRENLLWLDASAIAELMRREHPQVQAIILACLDTGKARAVLDCLPASSRAELLLRVADLDTLQPEALQAVAELVEQRQAAPMRVNATSALGPRRAAAILKAVEADQSDALLKDISVRDQGIGESLRELMFSLDDLLTLPAGDWRKVAEQVPDELLGRALLAGSVTVRERVLRLLQPARSRRVARIIRRDASQSPEAVQQAVADVLLIVRRMAAAGDIVIGDNLRLAEPV